MKDQTIMPAVFTVDKVGKRERERGDFIATYIGSSFPQAVG